MKIERKMLAILSLFVALILVLNIGIIGRNGGEGNDNREWNCEVSCDNNQPRQRGYF